MKNAIIILLVIIFYSVNIKSQTVYYLPLEGFEGNKIPDAWSQFYVSGTEPWKCKTGVGTGENPPEFPHNGNYNAAFYTNTLSGLKTMLITPAFDVRDAVKPELHFYYAQFYYDDEFGLGNARLSVYYRSVLNSTGWVKLRDFDEPVSDWTEGVVLIPDTAHFADVQIAFEGRMETEYHHGVCLDDIKVIETGVIPKFIKSVSASQASTDLVPTGSVNNPVLRLKFSVGGNDGSLVLNQLNVTTLLNSSEVVTSNGVKLFSTISQRFNDTTPITSGNPIIDNTASFTSLNHSLPIGDSYIWVCYDIDVDNNHQFKGKAIDAMFEQNSIKVNNSFYPETAFNPVGQRLISESMYYDDFENGLNWTLSGEFQIGKPVGKGGVFGQPDPTYARSGYNVLGVDLTGLGVNKGDYEKNVPPRGYIAQADTIINAKYYKNLNLEFYRWLNVYFTDSAQIDVSTDGGLTYRNIWTNSGTVTDFTWTFQQISLGNIADRCEQVKLRFSMGPTSNVFYYSGWNIDNLALTGTFVEADAGLTSLILPNNTCGHLTPEPVTVTVKNFGFAATNDTIPLGFSTDNGASWQMDTLFMQLESEQTHDFTFNQLIDITTPGYQRILIKTFLPNDEDTRNDQIDTTFFISPFVTPPYFENFEANNGFWRSYGDSLAFEHGTPADTIITHAYSGTKCWATNLAGNYKNNDSSWLVSPCFNFSDIDKPVFECMLWSDAEALTDGLALYYTLNEGATWNIVLTSGEFAWNWYNAGNISALGHQGWDSLETGWVKMRQILPSQTANQPVVKFKFVFASNDSITSPGFAIDDVKIYNAPVDAGVSALVSPLTGCYLTNAEQITVQIKNFGIRPFKATDTIFASIHVCDSLMVTDTVIPPNNIAVNSSFNYTFSGFYNFVDKKSYPILTYTSVEADSAYYIAGVYNDTLRDTIIVKGEPAFDLGPDIGTLQPDTVNIDAGKNLDNPLSYAYRWGDTSTLQVYEVPEYGTGIDEMMFFVTITNSDGCMANDSITVIKSVYDRGVVAFTGIDSSCVNAFTPNLTVDIKNFAADDIILTTDSIAVGYQINNLPEHIEYVHPVTDMGTDDIYTGYVFNTQPQITMPGLYNIKMFTKKRADLNYYNDTMYTAIRLYPLPTVNIGPDTIFTAQADSIIFNAGVDREYYKWLYQAPSAVQQTYNVPIIQTAKYFVEVQDTNLCGLASDTVMVVADNWVLDSIVSPFSSCMLTNTEQVRVKITNNSPMVYPNNYQLKARVVVNGVAKTDTITFIDTVTAYSSVYYNFTPVYNMSVPGTYNISANIQPQYDKSRSDNSLSSTVEVWGIYIVDIGPDTIFTLRADTITFDAGPNYNTYLWGDNSTGRYLTIPNANSNKYWVSVTTQQGCSNSSDTVEIMAYDIELDDIKNPISRCSLTNTNFISFTIINNGPDKIPAGTAIDFFYNINGGSYVQKPFVTTNAIEQGDNSTIIIPEDIELLNTETYSFNAYVKWDKDFFSYNDSITKLVYQYDSPTVSLGPDIYTTQADTLVLDAGQGQTTYRWQDLSENHFFNVTLNSTANYMVTVTNSYGCYHSDTMAVYTYDIIIADVLGIDNTCNYSKINPVSLGVKLNGTDTLPYGSVINALYSINNDTVYQQFILANRLAAGDTVFLTFDTPVNLIGPDNFAFSASVNINTEADALNNSFEADIRVGKYTVELGDNQITYADTIILDAGTNGIAAYLWNNGHTTQTIEATQSGQYSVTITDINNCTNSDSLQLFFMRPLYNIVQITGLNSACTNSTQQQISFYLKNNGNDTIKTDSTITIFYTVDNEPRVSQNYTFSSKFIPGDSLYITFDQTADLSLVSQYIINVNAVFGNDTTMLDTTINTWGIPVINLGNDTVTYAQNIVLDAGTGNQIYEWNNGTQNQTITVDQTGQYTVTVTSVNNCVNSDTINLKFMRPLYNITSIIGLADSCLHISPQQVSFILQNSGNDTIFADSTINISYNINGGSNVTENYIFTDKFVPGNQVTINFATNANLSATMAYNVNVFTTFGNLTPQLDTVVNTWGLPVVNLGTDIISYNSTETLDAGAGFASYQWSNGALTQQTIINQTGTYSVTVTSQHQCLSADTVDVKFMKPAYVINQIIGLADSCSRVDSSTIAFSLKNTGNDTIYQNDQILARYIINQNQTVEQNYTFSQQLNPQDTQVITFSKAAGLKAVGQYSVLVETVINSTVINADTIVNTFGIPHVNLGNDTIVQGENIVLDAGSGHAAYLWGTGATSQTINVSQPGKYWAQVTNSGGCINSDTIVVSFSRLTMVVTSLIEPVTACGRLIAAEVKIQATNTGTRTIPVGSVLNFGFWVNNSAAQFDEVELTLEKPAGSTLNYTFSKKLSVPSAGKHTVYFTAQINDGKIDTTLFELNINKLPVFSFASDTILVTSFPYLLNPNVDAQSYLWSNGEQTGSITVNSKNLYWLQVTDANGCLFTDSVYVTNTNSIVQTWGGPVKVYPNPANQLFNIIMPQVYNNLNIEVVSPNGKVVYTNNNAQQITQINVQNWSKGIYMVRVYSGNKISVMQVVVQ